jgi:hypothetical protein
VIVTSGNANVISPSAPFKKSDEGKLIELVGANAAGGVLTTTIATFVSSTTVTLASTPTASVAGGQPTWFGTNDLPALLRWMAAVNTAGGVGALTAGANYQCDFRGIATGSTLFTFTTPNSTTIDFAGGQIVGMRDFSIGGDVTVYFMEFTYGRNVTLKNIAAQYYEDTSANNYLRGVTTITLKGMGRTSIEGQQQGGRLMAWAPHEVGDSAADVCTGIDLNIRVQNAGYPFAAYEAFAISGTIVSIGCQRDLFVVNCKGVEVDVISTNAQREAIEIQCIKQTGRLTSYSDAIKIKPQFQQRTSAQGPGACIAVVMRTDGTGGASIYDSFIDFSIDGSGVAGSEESQAVALERQITTDGGLTFNDDSGPARGHYCELGFRGSFRNTDSTMHIFTVSTTVWPSGETVVPLGEWDIAVTGSSSQMLLDLTPFAVPPILNYRGPNTSLVVTNGSPSFGNVRSNSLNTNQQAALASNLTLYVGGAGASDTNLGLNSSQPLATIQAAVNVAKQFNLSGFTVTISVAAGTYSGAITAAGNFAGASGASAVAIVGAGSGTTTLTAGSGVNVLTGQGGVRFTLQALTIAPSGAARGINLLDQGSVCVMGSDVKIGATTAYKINVGRGAQLYVPTGVTLTLDGSADVGIRAGDQSAAIINGTLAFTGGGAYSTSILYANTRSLIDLAGAAVTGAVASGSAYVADDGSLKGSTLIAGLTGASAGSTANAGNAY